MSSFPLPTALMALLTASILGATPASQPNVIFILSDDHNWYDYSFMYRPGVEKTAIDANTSIDQVAKTPAVDRLVDEGLTYTRGYATPLCRPSLAAIASGTFPHQNWVVGNDMAVGNDLAVEERMQVMHPLAHTLATRLDYTSFQTGKWWEGHHSNGGFTAGDTANSGSTANAPPQYTGSKPGYVGGGRHGDWGLMTGRVDYVNDIPAPAHPIPYANTVETVTDFIDTQVTASNPFYIWYAPFLPHTPHDPPAGLQAEYTALGLNDADAKYYANVERFDGGVGAILDHLDAKGITNNTIVILICDNGRSMTRGKNSPYEGGIRTPIIVRWPDRIKVGGSIEPQVITSPASLIDMVPTIHHALNLPVFPEMTGVNLLDPAAVAARDTVFTTDYEHDIQVLGQPTTSLQAQIAIRDGWKLILYPNGSSELYHLYDTTTGAPVDPFENSNVSGSNPVLVGELTTEINEWYAHTPGRVITHSEASSFVVSNHDLLQTSLDGTTPVVTTGDFTDVGGTTVAGEPTLRNGVWDNDGSGRGNAGANDGNTVTYHFDLTASPLGYTIDQIDLYSNWGPAQDRDEIKVSIDYALVASPTNFDNHILIDESYNPPTQSQAKTSVSEIGTPGVAAIRFTFPASQESGAVGYSEIDVLGTADGSPTGITGLLSLTPADDSTNVAGDDDLVARFCEPMQPGTGFVRLFEAGGTPVETFDVTSSPRLTFSGNLLIIDPTANLVGGTSYYVQIDATAVDDFSGGSFVGITDTTSWSFTADGTAPTAVGRVPADNATEVPVTTTLSLTFDEDVTAGTGFVRLFLSNGTPVETFDVTSSPQLTISGPQLTVVPSSPLLGATDYYVQVDTTAIDDLSGNSFAGITDTTSWSFATDSTAPMVINRNPLDDASDVPTITTLDLAFDEDIQAGTGFVRLFLSNGTPVEIFDVTSSPQLTIGGSQLTVTPSTSLTGATSYYVQVDPTAIDDLAGNSFAGITDTTSWSFTTDSTAPSLLSTSPVNGATGVAPNTNLSLTFDEDIQVGTGNLTIHLVSDDSIVQSIDVTSGNASITGAVLTIDPPSNLAPLTNFYVNVPSGAVSDLSGNTWTGISGTSTWAFTTADAVQTVINSEFPDSPGPTVSNSDLLQTAFDSYNGSALDDSPSGPDTTYLQGLSPSGEASLRDGVWFSNADSRGSAMAENGEFAEYFLDLTASPLGYNIDQIDLYSNWGTGQGRDEIKVTIAMSLVGTPTVFDQTVVTNEVYNPPTETQGKMSIINIGASGIAAIRFDWPATQENNGVGYSEIDVFGAASAGDTVPPILTVLSPLNGANGVSVASSLSLTFDENVQAGTGDVTIHLASDDSVVQTINITSGSVLFSGSSVTIDPPSDLASGTSYYVNLPSGAVSDLASNSWPGISGSSSWAFTTANAAQTVANSEAASFTVSNTDLLQTAFSSYNGSSLDDAPGGSDTSFLAGLSPNGEASLRDGVWQDEGTQGRGAAMAENDEFAEYFLDLTASPQGYDIDQIDLYSNWGTGQGRDEIRVTIAMSLVGTPTIFDQVVVTNEVYNPPALTQGKMSINNIGATGIAAVRFDWPVTQENNGVGYSELDVLGSATAPPNNFNTWINNPAFGLLPSAQGFSMDVDGDGLPNGLEAWFGTHPGEFNQGISGLATDGTTTTFNHPQNESSPDDLSVFYEWSPNLTDWFDGDGLDGPSGDPTVNFVSVTNSGTTTVTATSSEPFDKLFLRIGVTHD